MPGGTGAAYCPPPCRLAVLICAPCLAMRHPPLRHSRPFSLFLSPLPHDGRGARAALPGVAVQPVARLGALTRRSRVLIVGCGEIGLRLARLLIAQQGRTMRHGPRVRALTSSVQRLPALTALGLQALTGNLDTPSGLRRLRALAPRVVYLAPPQPQGRCDERMGHFLRSGAARGVRALVYASTTGVYGERGGAWVDECSASAPASDRAQRRVDAEQRLRRFALSALGGPGPVPCIVPLRVPGIYAPERAWGTHRARLQAGSPALTQAEAAVFIHRIHADDLARVCLRALWRGRPLRALNVCDDTCMTLGDYLDFAAGHYGLPRLPRSSGPDGAGTAATGAAGASSVQSRRVRSQRVRRELGFVPQWPTVVHGLRGVAVLPSLDGRADNPARALAPALCEPCTPDSQRSHHARPDH